MVSYSAWLATACIRGSQGVHGGRWLAGRSAGIRGTERVHSPELLKLGAEETTASGRRQGCCSCSWVVEVLCRPTGSPAKMDESYRYPACNFGDSYDGINRSTVWSQRVVSCKCVLQITKGQQTNKQKSYKEQLSKE
jgi:hypothetical protein